MSVFHDLQDLFIDQLQDIFDAENQLVDALPQMAAASKSTDLKKAFTDHLVETREHVSRLRDAFQMLGVPAKGKRCKAMAGLVKEADEVLDAQGDPDVIDAALIAAAQRVEHYEIAVYGTLKAYAKQLGHKDILKLLEKTSDEEGSADKKLTKLAEGTIMKKSINKVAAEG